MTETLEVDFKKIPDWLLERRKLDEDWNRKYKALKLKQEQLIEQTLKDLKDPQITDYLQSRKSNFNFQDCEQVITLLEKSEESKGKTFFGGYSSTIIRDWQNLQKLYKVRNLHIVDLAKSMIQNVQYDIPGLKKSLISLDQQINSNHQKLSEYQTLVKTYQMEFEKQCQKYGIEGKNIELEVPAMVSQLPSFLIEISKHVKDNQDLQQCLDYYQKYTEYASDSKGQTTEWLRRFIATGDIPVENFEKGTNQEQPNQYDWYNDQRIKTNQQPQAQQPQNSEWEIIDSPTQVKTQDQAEPIEIDWSKYIDVAPVQEQPKSQYQETVLTSTKYRNYLISNLNEVLYFLRTRINSTKLYSTNALLQAYEDNDKSSQVFDISVEKMHHWLQQIEEILQLLAAQQFRQLLTLINNKKSQDRILDKLNQYKIGQERTLQNIQNSTTKIEELGEELKNNKEELQKLIQETQKMKQQTEQYLKELIKWNVVIIGDISKIK